MLFVALLVFALNINAGVPPIILTSPNDYQVLGVSADGRWATGVYVDNGQNTFGFLWNLESDNIQLLSTTFSSYGNSVSNDGTVVGHFSYIPATGGASFEVPGYYRGGAWHPVELPAGMAIGDTGSAGQGWGITPDGTRITGTLLINKSYTPFVWDTTNDGAIVRQLDISNPEGTTQHGIATCISPNGMQVGGWAYRYNRSCVLWDVTNGQKQYVGLQDHEHQAFNSVVSKFSPDGKKVIFGGGWDTNVNASDHTQWAYSVYDLETGDITELPALGGRNATIALYGISNDYTVVGSNSDFDSGRAVIYKAADAVLDPATGYYKSTNAQYLEDYLEAQGVDFSQYDIFYNPYSEIPQRTLFRGQDISADGNVICMLYYANDDGYAALRSMIVMLNQDDSHAAPQDINLRQMAGINTVEVKWSAPVRAVEGIKEFAVYRDNEKIATVEKGQTKYYDTNVQIGTHSYSIASVYDDEETMSSSMSLTVMEKMPQEPWGLFLRQKGVNNIFCQWETPASNMITKNWYNAKTANLAGFGIAVDDVDIEMGVRFASDELGLYAGSKINSVGFIPMSQQDAVCLNIYKYDADGHLQLLHTQAVDQNLDIRKTNRIVLDEPLALPENSDIVVAFSFHVTVGTNNIIGMDHGRYTPGYSDLVRFVDEADFYSYCNMRAEQGVPDYMSFMIDMILENEGTDTSADKIGSYLVYLDGEEVGRTADNSFTIANATLSTTATTKNVSVAALYEDGRLSETASGSVPVKAAFVGVDGVCAEPLSATSMTLSWDTPLDVDVFSLSYSGKKNGTNGSNGIKAPRETDYSFMAAAKYPQSSIKGYDGYNVTSLRFYPTGNAQFTFYVLKDSEIAREIPVSDYVLNEWNEVVLSEPLAISEQSSYTLVLEIYNATPDVAALAIDNTTPFVGVADLYSLDSYVLADSWNSISSQTGIRGNWMIGMVLQESEPHEAAVAGYDVYISKPGEANVKKVNSQMVNDNTYTHDFGEEVNGTGKVRIATYYEGRATVANGGVLNDYIFDSTDIRSLVINGVVSYVVYAPNGGVVRKGDGSVLDLGGLPRGTYTVSMINEKSEKTSRKIIIK